MESECVKLDDSNALLSDPMENLSPTINGEDSSITPHTSEIDKTNTSIISTCNTIKDHLGLSKAEMIATDDGKCIDSCKNISINEPCESNLSLLNNSINDFGSLENVSNDHSSISTNDEERLLNESKGDSENLNESHEQADLVSEKANPSEDTEKANPLDNAEKANPSDDTEKANPSEDNEKVYSENTSLHDNDVISTNNIAVCNDSSVHDGQQLMETNETSCDNDMFGTNNAVVINNLSVPDGQQLMEASETSCDDDMINTNNAGNDSFVPDGEQLMETNETSCDDVINTLSPTNESLTDKNDKPEENDLGENSNTSLAASKDLGNSNASSEVDETSNNLNEDNPDGDNDCSRTEQTRFLQCDDTSNNEAMDITEINAVDPFAQAADSGKNDPNDSMNVDENKKIKDIDMEITQNSIHEMDITKITDTAQKKNEINQEEMDITVINDKTDLEKKSQIDEDATLQEMDITIITDLGKKTQISEDATPQEMDIIVISDKTDLDKEKQLSEDATPQEMDITGISNNANLEKKNDINQEDTTQKKESNKITDAAKTDKISVQKNNDSICNEKDTCDSETTDNDIDVSEFLDTELEETETEANSILIIDVNKKAKKTDDNLDKTIQSADFNQTVTDSNDPGVNMEVSGVDGSSANLSRRENEKAGNNLTLKFSTHVINCEDVCIIPDTDIEFSNEPVVVSNLSSTLKAALESKNKQNDGNSISVIKHSSRPQRQAAKIAGAQIKATVKQLEYNEQEEDINIDSSLQICHQCSKEKLCKYKLLSLGKTISYLCSEACTAKYRESLNENATNKGNKNEANNNIQNVPKDSLMDKQSKDTSTSKDSTAVKEKEVVKSSSDASKLTYNVTQIRRFTEDGEFVRACTQCGVTIQNLENSLSWETMDYCSESCLVQYQTALSNCTLCKATVSNTSLGKYCVRFGYDIRQFCSGSCLEEYKKGLKACNYCQKDISNSVEGFLAPVGEKGQFRDFCTQTCMEKYEEMNSNTRPNVNFAICDVCKQNKLVRYEVMMDSKESTLCSNICFDAFNFVNTIKVDKCDMCSKYFDRLNSGFENFTIFFDDVQHNFCSKTCMNVYTLAKRKIVPCNWCKVKKYNFDMIKRLSNDSQGVKQTVMMCSMNCLTLYQVSIKALSSRRIKCDFCSKVAQAQYHLTMSDATVRNFCNYNCVMNFQGNYSKLPITLPGQPNIPTPAGLPKKNLSPTANSSSCFPVISCVKSLASVNNNASSVNNNVDPASIGGIQITAGANTSGPVPVSLTVSGTSDSAASATPIVPNSSTTNSTPAPYYVVVKPPQPVQMVNKVTQCKPLTHTKSVSCRPHSINKGSQVDKEFVDNGNKIYIPIPVPIYIPTPLHMYSLPTPVPFPIPIPIPVPIFIPTTRNSAKGIMKEIKKIQEKMPTDPFEAELLMMAEMVAEQKKQEDTSDSDDGDDRNNGPASPCGSDDGGNSQFGSGTAMETNSGPFGTDDVLQMALKMATEMDDQSNSSAVDLEAELMPNTISPAPPATARSENEEDVDDPSEAVSRESRGRKRAGRPFGSMNRRSSSGGTPSAKRPRKSSSVGRTAAIAEPPPPPAPVVPVEKPDANMCLKFTFGVNAWKQWVIIKNAELEKLTSESGRKPKLFKMDLLQLTAEELNYSLCLFVKEARKPNGLEYAPDTIYYFCLGIQQYLLENQRIDNIFTDPYYEKFTECLDDIAKLFPEVSDDSKLIVTRVEEEHLWESKQLGAHSPHVLLSTLMFFNTKHFNLTSVDEHMQLSFSHIMKHWKRGPAAPGTPGSNNAANKSSPGPKNVLLRFYPPQSALDANAKKKKVYEQQENEQNPLRCPVKLYEFYLSKCPESVKSRNDVFYLLPERSCVPDSPVWYSTMALGKEPLLKMLRRVKMVKEINIALRSA